MCYARISELTTDSSQTEGAEDVVSCVKGLFQLGCRLEQRCFLFLFFIIHTSGS